MVDKAAEAAGYTIRGFHGTTHLFNIFDRSKGNAEGNWGKGFYFTNNKDDVEANYANPDGADLTNRIELLAEQLERQDGYEDMDYEERKEEARKLLDGGETRIITAALRINNPVVIGSHADMPETFFDFDSGYNPETDEYDGEESGLLADFADAWNMEMSSGRWYPDNISPFELFDGSDGYTAEQLEKASREILDKGGIVNENGEFASGEFLRSVFERMGFDGIVDSNVNFKFGTQRKYGQSMAGVDEGTIHFIAFHPEQIKQTDAVTYDDNGEVIPLSQRFDVTNDDIRFSLPGSRNHYNNGGDVIDDDKVLARAMYEQRLRSSLYQITEALQDSMLSCSHLQRGWLTVTPIGKVKALLKNETVPRKAETASQTFEVRPLTIKLQFKRRAVCRFFLILQSETNQNENFRR
jgi:hypothetical protein